MSRCVWWRRHGAMAVLRRVEMRRARPRIVKSLVEERRSALGEPQSGIYRDETRERNAPLPHSALSRGQDVAQSPQAEGCPSNQTLVLVTKKYTWRGSGVCTITLPLNVKLRARLR